MPDSKETSQELNAEMHHWLKLNHLKDKLSIIQMVDIGLSGGDLKANMFAARFMHVLAKLV